MKNMRSWTLKWLLLPVNGTRWSSSSKGIIAIWAEMDQMGVALQNCKLLGLYAN